MLNKVQFIGHLGRDAELRYMPDGRAVCNFSVAASEKWKDKASGEKMERTEWLRCNTFERLAEVCGEWLKKGSLVYVEGSLQTRKYTDKDGVERSVTECRVERMKMLGGRTDEAGAPAQQQRSAPAQRPAPTTRPAPQQRAPDDDPFGDVPF